MIEFEKLPKPQSIEELDFEKILIDIVAIFKKKVPDIDFLESDMFMPVLEAMAYREMLLRSRINDAYKAMLLPTATGGDLDNLVSMYAVTRLQGSKPHCEVEFSLTEIKADDVLLPAGIRLVSNNGEVANLLDDVHIAKGELKAVGRMQLNVYSSNSDVKCEIIQTPLPYVTKAKQLTKFSGGSDVESDEKLRVRAVQSLFTFSTAGSYESYVYHVLASDTRVQDMYIDDSNKKQPGKVSIYVKATSEDISVIENILNTLNNEKVRPLTDIVEVAFAKKIIKPFMAVQVKLRDMIYQGDVHDAVLEKVSKLNLKISEGVPLSYFYKLFDMPEVMSALIDPTFLGYDGELGSYIEIDKSTINIRFLSKDEEFL